MGSCDPVCVRVPASTANLGSGFDTIGLAVDRYLTATYAPSADVGTLVIDRRGTLAAFVPVFDERDLFVRAFRSGLAERGVYSATGTVTLDSDIPLSRGLGSSAAAVVAGEALAAAAFGEVLDRAATLRAVRQWEFHLDNAAPCLYGGLVAIARDEAGEPRAFPLELARSLEFAYAAPAAPLMTFRARAALPLTVPHSTAAHALGHITALVRGLATGDVELLRLGFADGLHVPYRLPLIPGGSEAVAAGLDAGAWAVTVSGAGSGLFAVVPPGCGSVVADAMAAAFRSVAGEDGVVAFPLVPDMCGTQRL